jgi:hypothetical protein
LGILRVFREFDFGNHDECIQWNNLLKLKVVLYLMNINDKAY